MDKDDNQQVVKWLVEEYSQDGVLLTSTEYSEYCDAIGVFNDIKENNPNHNVTIRKSGQRLLLG